MFVEFVEVALLCLFPVLVITAGLFDVTSYTIPNWISLALVGLFIPAALAGDIGWQGFAMAFGVAAVALAVAIFMFAMNWIGGGDAKLLAAASLWVGWPHALEFLVVTALAGGLLAVSLLAMRSGWVRRYAASGPGWMGRLATPDGPAPYGVAIAVGALIVFPHSALMGG